MANASVSLYSWPKVILFGDSLTQYGFSKDGCWASSIADKLQRKCDVINRGFSGYNSRWCKLMLPRLVTKNDVQNVAAFVIFLGANDSNLPASTQHVPCDEFKANIEHMVNFLMEIGVEKDKLILVSPPPCVETKWAIELEKKGKTMTQDNKYKQQYAVACRSVASHVGCRYVDAYMKFMGQSDWKDMLNDGLHFAEKGAELLASLVWPEIDALTSNLPLAMPDWADIDVNHPENSLLPVQE